MFLTQLREFCRGFLSTELFTSVKNFQLLGLFVLLKDKGFGKRHPGLEQALVHVGRFRQKRSHPANQNGSGHERKEGMKLELGDPENDPGYAYEQDEDGPIVDRRGRG